MPEYIVYADNLTPSELHLVKIHSMGEIIRCHKCKFGIRQDKRHSWCTKFDRGVSPIGYCHFAQFPEELL